MNHKADIQIHFVLDDKKSMELARKWVSHVPSVGDEIRLGGEGNEKFYTVTRIVWVYDEQENPFDRVNIGVAVSL